MKTEKTTDNKTYLRLKQAEFVATMAQLEEREKTASDKEKQEIEMAYMHGDKLLAVVEGIWNAIIPKNKDAERELVLNLEALKTFEVGKIVLKSITPIILWDDFTRDIFQRNNHEQPTTSR